MPPTATTPSPIARRRPQPAAATGRPHTPARRILHLTTEYPPVICGGLGTAVGGWVTAATRAGMTVGVLLLERPLVLDPAAYGAGTTSTAAQRHGLGRPPGRHVLPDLLGRGCPGRCAAGAGLARRRRPPAHRPPASSWPAAPGLAGAQLQQQWLPAELAAYQSQIHFTGWLTPEQVAAWYRRADVLVVPSRYEPFGMVILEGMLHGLPIIASNIGGPAEILHDQHTGILFPPMDVTALGRQLIRLVQTPTSANSSARPQQPNCDPDGYGHRPSRPCNTSTKKSSHRRLPRSSCGPHRVGQTKHD